MRKWKKQDSRELFGNAWIKIFNNSFVLPNKSVINDYVTFETKDVAMVFPLAVDNKIIFVRQYKPGPDEVNIELPAGYIEHGEKPEAAARRELLEETGYESADLTLFGSFISNNARSSQRIFFFFGKNAEKKSGQNLDHTEDIELLQLNKAETLNKINEGSIASLPTVALALLGIREMEKCGL